MTGFLHWQLEVSPVELVLVVVAIHLNCIENIELSLEALAADTDAFDTFASLDLREVNQNQSRKLSFFGFLLTRATKLHHIETERAFTTI
jgi:hypothetical protein